MSNNLFPENPVLIVDDEAHALQSFEIVLRAGGIDNFISCQDSQRVMPLLAAGPVEVLLLDLWMPNVSGEEILDIMLKEFPDVPVIIVTGVNEVDTAVKCMKSGAFDYIVKPVDRERLLSAIRRAIELRGLRRENARLRDCMLAPSVEHPEAFSAILTNNDGMEALFRYVEAIAVTSQSVLVTGETGVGKELFARAVHSLSNRSGKFVSVNVAGLDDQAFSDTLFGHSKGAFTGADQARSGLIERAAGGTLFLDEIGDLNTSSQVKLLRFLQEREYLPLGSDVLKRTDTRIIVATNQDIQEAQRTGRIRKDLYYRLCTHHIQIPPLRERFDDLPLLTEHFLQEASEELGKRKPHVPKELFVLLGTYSFLGNIRELRAMVFDTLSHHESGTLSLERFRLAMGRNGSRVQSGTEQLSNERTILNFPDELPTLRQNEEQLVKEALRRAAGNQGIAAEMLGISRQALNQRLKRGKPVQDILQQKNLVDRGKSQR